MIKIFDNRLLNAIVVFGPAILILFAIASRSYNFVLIGCFVAITQVIFLIYKRFYATKRAKIERDKNLEITISIIAVMAFLVFVMSHFLFE